MAWGGGELRGVGLHPQQLAPCPPSLFPLSHEPTRLCLCSDLLGDLALALISTSQLMLIDPVPISPPSEIPLQSLYLPPLSSLSPLFLPVISLLWQPNSSVHLQ